MILSCTPGDLDLRATSQRVEAGVADGRDPPLDARVPTSSRPDAGRPTPAPDSNEPQRPPQDTFTQHDSGQPGHEEEPGGGDSEQPVADGGLSCSQEGCPQELYCDSQEGCPEGLYCDYAGRCVECSFDDQCSPGWVCWYGECVPGCNSDRDCVPGMRCNKQFSRCELQRCDWDGDCPSFSVCLGDYCVPYDPNDPPPDDPGESQAGDDPAPPEGTPGAGGSGAAGSTLLEAGTPPDASADAGQSFTF